MDSSIKWTPIFCRLKSITVIKKKAFSFLGVLCKKNWEFYLIQSKYIISLIEYSCIE